ncbi:MAG TPA: PRC-barrel domain-containing protein, partial [Rubrobacter sp.]|nr:PRC-barrel domain-containing protein [Rubrobacter sp.]
MFTGNPDSGTQITSSRRLIQEENVASEDRLRELEEKYEDYKVYDNQGERIGKVDDLFVDESDREEYIGVKMGFFGMKSTLIPMDLVRVNEEERSIEVSDSKSHVRSAPSFDDDEDITPDYEDRIRSYFGLESLGTSEGGYGAYTGTD